MVESPAAGPFLRVTEIFLSIQGESTWAGLPCAFVRLTGCPLRCVWCDTEYSFFGGEKLRLDEIVRRVEEVSEITRPVWFMRVERKQLEQKKP